MIIKLLSTLFGIAVVVALLAWGISAQKNHDEKFPWKGSFYKGVAEERQLTASDDFKNLNDCYDWTQKQADLFRLKDGQWEFSCGNDCAYKDDTIISGKRIKTYECAELVTE